MQQAKSDVKTEAQLAIHSSVISVVGQAAYALAALMIWLYWKDVAPPQSVRIWTWLALISFGLSAAYCAVLISGPTLEKLVTVWLPLGRWLAQLFDLQGVIAILLLFPHGDVSHRMVAAAYCIGYGPLQLIADPDNIIGNRISVVAILGAFAAQLFITNDPARWILAVMILVYGATLLIGANIFRNAVLESIARRRQSEEDAVTIRKALEEVSHSRDAKTRFIANASHDLGQPLVAAALYAGQLQGRAPAVTRDKAISGLNTAIASAQSLVSHMLSYLRLESDAVKPNLLPVKSSDLLGNAAKQMFGKAAELKTRLEVKADDHLINCDAALMHRALVNLIDNAITHGKAKHVNLTTTFSGAVHRISIMDDGIGIPEGERQRVFEDYFQGENCGGGFGLGLASVARIARLHGGTAWLDPDTAQGAAFHVEIPAQ